MRPQQAGRSDSDSQLFGILAPTPGYLNTTGDNNVSVGYYAHNSDDQKRTIVRYNQLDAR